MEYLALRETIELKREVKRFDEKVVRFNFFLWVLASRPFCNYGIGSFIGLEPFFFFFLQLGSDFLSCWGLFFVCPLYPYIFLNESVVSYSLFFFLHHKNVFSPPETCSFKLTSKK